MNPLNVQVGNSAPSHPASTYLSKVKLIATCLLFVFALQMVSAHDLHAGCAESGLKSAITTGVVAGGLLFLDCLFGCPVSAATAGTAAAAALTAVKAAILAALYGCVDASLWDKPSRPSLQPR